jgi:hypothetical protein
VNNANPAARPTANSMYSAIPYTEKLGIGTAIYCFPPSLLPTASVMLRLKMSPDIPLATANKKTTPKPSPAPATIGDSNWFMPIRIVARHMNVIVTLQKRLYLNPILTIYNDFVRCFSMIIILTRKTIIFQSVVKFRWVQKKCRVRPLMGSIQYRRLSDKQKKAIVGMFRTGEWKQSELADMFQCTPGRVSQLVNNVYGEHQRLGVEVEK